MVLLLLFMQLATAAYSCPTELRTLHDEATMATMPGCDGNMPRTMDVDLPQLCKAHRQQGEQVVGGAPLGDWTPLPLLLAVIDWRHSAQADVAPAHPWAVAPPGAVPPGSPPLYLSLLVLRN
ncbi:MAG: hypothetical protein U1E72_01970 [Burkholderiaceae bacterium]